MLEDLINNFGFTGREGAFQNILIVEEINDYCMI
jgi:hypothetical protein